MRSAMAGLAAALILAGSAEAASIDFRNYFPNWQLAPTHALVSTDGTQRLTFSSATDEWSPSGGTWGRSLRPCTSDWQMWTPTALVYLGWVYFCDGASEVDWVAPPAFGPPPVFDVDVGWHSDFQSALTRIPYGPDGAMLAPTVTVAQLSADIRRDSLPTGEPAILMTVLTWNDSEERWWFVDCIAVDNAACAPGVRRILIVHAGATVLDVTFTRWVPR